MSRILPIFIVSILSFLLTFVNSFADVYSLEANSGGDNDKKRTKISITEIQALNFPTIFSSNRNQIVSISTDGIVLPETNAELHNNSSNAAHFKLYSSKTKKYQLHITPIDLPEGIKVRHITYDIDKSQRKKKVRFLKLLS